MARIATEIPTIIQAETSVFPPDSDLKMSLLKSDDPLLPGRCCVPLPEPSPFGRDDEYRHQVPLGPDLFQYGDLVHSRHHYVQDRSVVAAEFQIL